MFNWPKHGWLWFKITCTQTDSENLGYDEDNNFFDIPKVAPLQEKESTQKRHPDYKNLENLVLKSNSISQIWLSPKKEKESLKICKKKENALLQKEKQTSLTHESEKQRIEIGEEQVHEEKNSNATYKILGAKHEKFVKRKISLSSVHESKKQKVEAGSEQFPLEVSISVHEGKMLEVIEEKQTKNEIICSNVKAKKKCGKYMCTGTKKCTGTYKCKCVQKDFQKVIFYLNTLLLFIESQ